MSTYVAGDPVDRPARNDARNPRLGLWGRIRRFYGLLGSRSFGAVLGAGAEIARPSFCGGTAPSAAWPPAADAPGLFRAGAQHGRHREPLLRA